MFAFFLFFFLVLLFLLDRFLLNHLFLFGLFCWWYYLRTLNCLFWLNLNIPLNFYVFTLGSRCMLRLILFLFLFHVLRRWMYRGRSRPFRYILIADLDFHLQFVLLSSIFFLGFLWILCYHLLDRVGLGLGLLGLSLGLGRFFLCLAHFNNYISQNTPFKSREQSKWVEVIPSDSLSPSAEFWRK